MSRKKFSKEEANMLKRAGLWQELSVEQRLVLMAISYELPNIGGLGVLGSDVMSITGLPRLTVEGVSVDLESKGLLRLAWQPHMLYLSGDAMSQDLCGDKLAAFEARERRKYGVQLPASDEAQPQPTA